MPELQNLTNAKDMVTLFRVNKGTPETVLDDYAKIAWFFTQRGEFEASLALISSMLWNRYCTYQKNNPGLQKNLFTSAIRKLSTDLGWRYDTNESVVLVGAVSSDQYLAWATQGVFFKDDMDLKHGEHSHTFQWLVVTIARHKIGLTHDPTYLYKNIFEVKPRGKQEMIVPGFKHPSNSQGAVKDYNIWAWVADCFPTTFATGGVMPAEPSLFSDTYRTPQVVMQYLLDTAPTDHFIAEYLRNRYKKRNWFAGGPISYSSVSGSTAKRYATDKLSQNPAWIPVGVPEPTAFMQTPALNLRATAKNTVSKTFHGTAGIINAD
jgi:Family of unknown function (DUF5636)